jgi:hypothetical protein
MVHRVQKFVEVGSDRIGYALTSAALSEASGGETDEQPVDPGAFPPTRT